MDTPAMNASVHRLCIALLILLLFSGCAATQGDLLLIRDQAYEAYRNRNYDTAVSKFEYLVSRVPEDGEFWFRLGNSYARSQKPQLAVDAYQKALIRVPANEKAWYNMGLVQTETALKTFVDMQQYTQHNSTIGKKGEEMRQGLFDLLGKKNDQKAKQ